MLPMRVELSWSETGSPSVSITMKFFWQDSPIGLMYFPSETDAAMLWTGSLTLP